MELKETFQRVKAASRQLAALTDDERNRVLLAVADAIEEHKAEMLAANGRDLKRMERSHPLYDRLLLTDSRLSSIAADMRNVAALPSPLGIKSRTATLANGLRLCRISVPFGVVGIVYEARPNVTFDVFSLCFKSGNACLLKGGKDADHSNRTAIGIIRRVLEREGICPDVATLLPATHEATGQLLNAVGYVDVCIPRGGRRLIDFVRQTARVPVIETGAGVVHAYFDKAGDVQMGRTIINNAKTRRPSVCNALDTLLVHKDREADIPQLLAPLLSPLGGKPAVTLYADEQAFATLSAHLSPLTAHLLQRASSESFDTEFMDYKMNVVTVGSIDEALAHIAQHGSGHSECIITQDEAAARRFQAQVDAACVYWNAPTSFTDGAQFGLGAEIGISTQKLGPRGPMGLQEITTYKWLIEGEGQVRE